MVIEPTDKVIASRGTDTSIDGVFLRSSFFRWCAIRNFLPPISLKKFYACFICRHQKKKIHVCNTGNIFLHIGTFTDNCQFETKARLPHKPEVSTNRYNQFEKRFRNIILFMPIYIQLLTFLAGLRIVRTIS